MIWFKKNFKHSPLSREVSVRPRKWESGLLMSALNPWVECRVRSGALWVDQRSGLFTFQLRIFLSGWPNCSMFPGSSLTALKRSTSPLYVSFPSELLPLPPASLSLSPSLPPESSQSTASAESGRWKKRIPYSEYIVVNAVRTNLKRKNVGSRTRSYS